MTAERREVFRIQMQASLGVQCELVSGINKSGNPRGEGRWYYFVDGDKREFGTQDELMAALVGER